MLPNPVLLDRAQTKWVSWKLPNDSVFNRKDDFDDRQDCFILQYGNNLHLTPDIIEDFCIDNEFQIRDMCLIDFIVAHRDQTLDFLPIPEFINLHSGWLHSKISSNIEEFDFNEHVLFTETSSSELYDSIACIGDAILLAKDIIIEYFVVLWVYQELKTRGFNPEDFALI